MKPDERTDGHRSRYLATLELRANSDRLGTPAAWLNDNATDRNELFDPLAFETSFEAGSSLLFQLAGPPSPRNGLYSGFPSLTQRSNNATCSGGHAPSQGIEPFFRRPAIASA